MGNFNNAVDDFLLSLDKTDHDESSPIYQSGMRQLILSYNDFGIQCFNRGYFDEAVSLLNKAIRAEKAEKGLYINRGDCFFRMKNYHFSLADYQQALELDTDDWDVKSRISLIFNEFAMMDYFERRYLEAERKFTLALQHNPKVSQYYISRARVRHLLDFKRGAREDVLCALHLAPSNEELFSLIARLFPGKSLMEIKASPIFDATVKKLNNAFQLCAPKRPNLRPMSSVSATSQIAANLSAELPVVLPSSLGPSRQDHTSATSRKTKSGSSWRSQSSHKEESSRRSNMNMIEDFDSESGKQEAPAPTRKLFSGDRLVRGPYSPSETRPLDMEALTTTKEFMKRKRQLNENVKKMLDSSTSLGSIKNKPSVLVNAPNQSESSKNSRWGSAKRSGGKQ